MSRQKPIVVRITTVASVALLIISAGAAAFVAGYWLAFSGYTEIYAETSLLKARAVELEAEILHLKNYAVLIDAIALRGEASKELINLPAAHTSEPKANPGER